jgi:hypothetical protein
VNDNPGCFLAQFSSKPCDGRLIRAHLISKQTIRRECGKGWRFIADDPSVLGLGVRRPYGLFWASRDAGLRPHRADPAREPPSGLGSVRCEAWPVVVA